MARLFLTNIDLNTNELQNAVVQNLSSAPLSGNKEGRIYYDITSKQLYLYTDGQWKPLASGGAATSSLELTGDVTGSASVDSATGKITLATTVVNNSVALGDDTTGDYVKSISGTANQISVSVESGEGVQPVISLPSIIAVSGLSIGDGSGSIQFDTGVIKLNSVSDIVYISDVFSINGVTGTIGTDADLVLSPGSGNVVINNNLVTDTITSKNDGADTLTVSADSVGIAASNVTIGGAGIDGSFTIKDSTGVNALSVNGDTKEAQFAGNVTIDGNLNVEGTVNAINRTEVNLEDNTIRLNTGLTGSPTADAGIIVERGTANDTAIIWSETNDQWTLTNDGSNYYAIARKYVEVVGDASNTSFDVVHNLGTRDVTVMVRENNSEYNVVETDILMKDGNTVTIAFTDAPALNSYKVIIVG